MYPTPPLQPSVPPLTPITEHIQSAIVCTASGKRIVISLFLDHIVHDPPVRGRRKLSERLGRLRYCIGGLFVLYLATSHYQRKRYHLHTTAKILVNA